MNPNLKRPVLRLINQKTKGVDVYHNNGSTWLIFTDKKKWVIELAKDGTLWYNYYFFKNVFDFFSLNVIENQNYITEWVEDTIQNGVIHTAVIRGVQTPNVEDTIQNGVRNTKHQLNLSDLTVEETIQNGVINTTEHRLTIFTPVEDAIQNGVRSTYGWSHEQRQYVDDAIQNGVKHTEPGGYLGSIEMKGKIVHQLESPKQNNEVEDVIENGVKRIVSYKDRPEPTVEGIIQSGIKETKQEPSQRTWKVGEVIKETKSPGADGDLLSTIEWMESNNTESVPKMIDDIITNGIKETKKIEHDRTTYHGYFNQERGSHTPLDTVQDVLKNGIKHTQPHVLEILNPIGFEPTLKENKRMNEVNNVLDKGIKEVIELPDQSGELNGYGEYYARQKNRAYPHIDTVNDVIRDGIKETNWRKVDNFPEFEERVIQNGIKETWAYERQPQQRVNQVIEQGTKENPSL